ncbi:hypothetical protein HQQ94_06575 [Shewanella sp. VB17]|uniref:hypothetical protein n=1 Tax=Shewanella sp. VB17 TaxID=2739432 RepID=UPI00156484F3|nr:hypothetical protein [Shewanella sp. VB17]NRD72908.1 hypothetical protein [Shewanella sp. VB17]
MKVKLLCVLTLLASVNVFAVTEASDVDNKKEGNQQIAGDVLETANLMDEINLLELKLAKEKLDKSLNEALLSNIEIKKEIDKYHSVGRAKVDDPADGPFNQNGIRLLSVTSLQNSQKMAVFSFYGRKYNRAPGETFKGSNVLINADDVVFSYNGQQYTFRY